MSNNHVIINKLETNKRLQMHTNFRIAEFSEDVIKDFVEQLEYCHKVLDMPFLKLLDEQIEHRQETINFLIQIFKSFDNE